MYELRIRILFPLQYQVIYVHEKFIGLVDKEIFQPFVIGWDYFIIEQKKENKEYKSKVLKFKNLGLNGRLVEK